MIEQALRSFCEARHRTLIVIAGTFVVGLVLVLPLVDVIRAGHDEKEALLTELDSAKTVAAGLKNSEAQVNKKLAELDVQEKRTVDEASVPALRDELVGFAKDTGCSVRRITVGGASSRAWSPGENPIGPPETKLTETKSRFRLEWRPVNLSLTGTSASLRSMLERVSGSGKLMHAKSFEMYPSSPTRQTLTLDLELWYYTLAKRG
jgi:hypothetical protein